jgi:hypothetical protein
MVLVRGNAAKVGGGEVSCHFGKLSRRMKYHGEVILYVMFVIFSNYVGNH